MSSVTLEMVQKDIAEMKKRFQGMETAFMILVKNLAEFEKKLDTICVDLADVIVSVAGFMEMMGQRTEDVDQSTQMTYG